MVDESDDEQSMAASEIFDVSTWDGWLKLQLSTILNSNWFNAITGLVTTFALFGDDLRIMAFTGRGSADLVFSILNVIGMGIFTVEICGLCYTKPDYLFGFYFYLDVISTGSMILDIRWFSPEGTGDSAASVARTGKVSKSAKSGRLVRIARLVRLVRIVKLFKLKKNIEEEDEDDEEVVAAQPSKVAKKLTELTTRHIIRILIVMVVMFPIFDDPNTFTPVLDAYIINGLDMLYNVREPSLDLTDAADRRLANEVGSSFCFAQPSHEFCVNLRQWTTWVGKLRYLRVENVRYDNYLRALYFHAQGKGALEPTPPGENKKKQGKNAKKRPKGKRESEKRHYTKKNKQCENDPCSKRQRWNPRRDLEGRVKKLRNEYGWRFDTDVVEVARFKNENTYCIIDETETSRFEAMLNLLRMVVVMVVLMSAVIVFTQDATTLVVGPIERMMTLVQRLAENPLGDLQKKTKRREDDTSDETYLLEQTLAKISGLLQVGFGVAGAEVISKSMATEQHTGEKGLNYMLPGKRITAVFGFAIIEDFTVTCGCLEEQTCTYINTIAKIVHEAAHAFHGAPNKNIGCAFLLVWKICDGLLPGIRDLRDAEPPPNTPEFRQWREAQRVNISWPSQAKGDCVRLVPPLEMVESALASFLKAQVDLHHANRSTGVLEPFRAHAKMKTEFGDDFKVHMGFGLHIGWAIEGTIGSRFKIDASYLSPNVNTAARLEAATHMYMCPLLMSGFYVDEMSPAARSFCRMIDVVSVKGSQVPLELWTFDISNYPENTLTPNFDEHTGQQVPVDFKNDLYFRELQKGIDPLFMQAYSDAVQEYVAGDWAAAKDALTRALKRYPDDGPSKLLMRVLAKDRFAAPPNWQGFRALTSKT